LPRRAARELHRHPLLSSFDYILRIDDGARLDARADGGGAADPFAALAAGAHAFSPLTGGWAAHHTMVNGMQAAVGAYIDEVCTL
jgi:hypothetical protein